MCASCLGAVLFGCYELLNQLWVDVNLNTRQCSIGAVMCLAERSVLPLTGQQLHKAKACLAEQINSQGKMNVAADSSLCHTRRELFHMVSAICCWLPVALWKVFSAVQKLGSHRWVLVAHTCNPSYLGG
jgi:hypothetical protein